MYYGLKVTANSKMLSSQDYDTVQFCGNGVEIVPAREDDYFPVPWDADFNIENGNFIMTGGAGPSGFGKCNVSIPLRSVSNCLVMNIWIDDDEVEEIMDIFKKYNWSIYPDIDKF